MLEKYLNTFYQDLIWNYNYILGQHEKRRIITNYVSYFQMGMMGTSLDQRIYWLKYIWDKIP